MWRTHSCVQRSHSCERVFKLDDKTRPRSGDAARTGVHTQVNASSNWTIKRVPQEWGRGTHECSYSCERVFTLDDKTRPQEWGRGTHECVSHEGT
jgi:hypothetical protein